MKYTKKWEGKESEVNVEREIPGRQKAVRELGSFGLASTLPDLSVQRKTTNRPI